MVSIKSGQEKYQCYLKENEELIIDTTEERGGRGVGIRPHQLLEAALASCMNITLRKSAEDIGIDLENVETIVQLNRDTAGKAIFEYSYKISDNLACIEKERISEALKGCAVRNTLTKTIEFKEIID